MHRLLILLVALAVAVVLAPAAHADPFTVSTLVDEADDGECAVDCTLREAIGRANASAATDDVITLPEGRVVLTQGELLATSPMTIAGRGAGASVVDADGASRVFNLTNGDEPVVLRDLAVTNGEAPMGADGGGILGSGSITLERVMVRGNTASMAGGGIAIPPESGGGSPTRKLTVIDSTIWNNRVAGGAINGQGGGIMAFAALEMVNATVADNEVANTGTTQGGGIVQSTQPAKLTNVTISGNRITTGGGAGGGLAGNNLAAVGGITVTPANTQLEARNVIIANNTVGGTLEDCELVTASSSVTNVSTGEGCGFADPGSRQNTDPKLTPVGLNGGPVSTAALSPDSPVIDLGTNAGCPAADARGFARPSGASCDPGAVEAATPAVTGGTPSNVTSSGATIAGAVTTNPSPFYGGEAYIELGETTAYGRRSASTAFSPLAANVPLSARFDGLAPNTEYHFRLVARTQERWVVGPDGTTKTAALPAPKPHPPGGTQPKARPRISTKGSTSTKRCLRTRYTLKIRATPASGLKVKSVRVTLDGKRRRGLKARTSQTLRISVRKLKRGRHTLKITVTDSANRSTTLTRRFTRCGPRRR